MPRQTSSVSTTRLETEIDNLPSKYPLDPDLSFIKHPPEYLGKSGNFYNSHNHHVQNIGQCVAVCRDQSKPGNPVIFSDNRNTWYDRYVPHIKNGGN